MAVSKRTTKPKNGKPGKDRYDVRLRGPDGREVSRTFRTVKEAERYEREQLRSRDRGEWVDPAAGRVTLSAWVEEWSSTIVHLRPSSRRILLDNLRLHVLPALGDHPLAGLTSTVLAGWLSDLSTKPARRRERLAPASVHQAYRALSQVLRAAVQHERLGRNPLDAVKPPKVERVPVRVLTPSDVASLAEAIDARYRALVLVAAYCGLRLGELAGLRWNRVNLLHRTLHVVEQLDRHSGRGHVTAPPKTRAGVRAVAIPPGVVEALDAHRVAGYSAPGADGYVFTSPDGSPLDVDNFRRRQWVPAVKRAGLDGLTIHQMRHACASLAIAAGADVLTLQRMLGHASAAMTLDQYGHLMPGQAETVAQRLDELMRGAQPAPLADVERIAPRDGRGMDTG